MLPQRFSVLKIVALFFVLWGLLAFVGINRHSKSKLYTYQSEFWADKAGYLIYLSMTFHYQWNASLLPDSIESKSGGGVKMENEVVKTKYPIGTSVLIAPFYAMASQFSNPNHSELITPLERASIHIAASFWLLIGLFCCFYILKSSFTASLSFGVILTFLLGTNLLYYTIFEGSMSHVYSFSLFSILAFVFHLLNSQPDRLSFKIIAAVICALIFITRPINVLFIPLVFAFSFHDHWCDRQFRNQLMKLKHLGLYVLSAFLVFVPQMIYWKYVSGQWFYDSYQNESFSNLFSPQVAKVLFSTNNGLMVFSPFWLLITYALIDGIFRKKPLIQISTFSFLLMIGICSSWHDYSFGCSFGQRNFADISSLMMFPVASFLKQNQKKSFLVQAFFWSLIFLAICWNLKLMFSFDYCWFGGEWDFKAIQEMLFSALK